MTPQEKAKELVDKFYQLFKVTLENSISIREAKQCALIAVDEILSTYLSAFDLQYSQQVKQLIEKL